MKAKRVKGLDADGDFATNARRIVEVRLRELEKLAAKALRSGEAQQLHDMRIAAKRLRYVLEIAEPAFGPAAKQGAKTVRRLQEVLGEIHDCDEMLPRLAEHADRLRAQDAAALTAATPANAKDVDPAAAAVALNGSRYVGIETLATYLRARRRVLLGRLVSLWEALEPRGFGADLRDGLRPPAPTAPADGAAL